MKRNIVFLLVTSVTVFFRVYYHLACVAPGFNFLQVRLKKALIVGFDTVVCEEFNGYCDVVRQIINKN